MGDHHFFKPDSLGFLGHGQGFFGRDMPVGQDDIKLFGYLKNFFNFGFSLPLESRITCSAPGSLYPSTFSQTAGSWWKKRWASR